MRLRLPLLLLVAALPLAAQQPPNEIALSVGRTGLSRSGELPAIGVSYNRFWTRVASTRGGVLVARDAHLEGRGEDRFTAVYASAEYHPFRGRLVSPRLGGGVALASSRVDTGFGDPESDSEITVIASAGADVSLTRRFALGAELLYVPYTPASRDRFGLQWDPLTLFASARFRW